MGVDFNKARLDLQLHFNRVIDVLQEKYNIEEESIVLNSYECQKIELRIELLKTFIVTIMCSYIEGSDEVKDLTEQINLKSLDIELS